jgi:hypothetical protein
LNLLLSQSLYTLKRILLILRHVVVPRARKLHKLLSLNLLNVLEFLVLRVLHLTHLPLVLYLSYSTHFIFTTFRFEVIKFLMTLIEIVTQHSTAT